jgi:hypothetical protein
MTGCLLSWSPTLFWGLAWGIEAVAAMFILLACFRARTVERRVDFWAVAILSYAASLYFHNIYYWKSARCIGLG